ncbi:MAG: DUF5340 domain-containing protein [Coleofasciculaceae cyanobacterium SM2_1_6]|nr:DUF5340 domain-containing protein [Coleofasciculaceae cyanobacterium SM2_1_6]
MSPLPLPSHVHYELLLQLLEQQTAFAANQQPQLREQVQQLIYSLRKALTQQKQIENTCEQFRVPVEYRWSINLLEQDSEPTRVPTREPIKATIPESSRELTRESVLDSNRDSEKSELGGVH